MCVECVCGVCTCFVFHKYVRHPKGDIKFSPLSSHQLQLHCFIEVQFTIPGGKYFTVSCWEGVDRSPRGRVEVIECQRWRREETRESGKRG